MEKNDKLRILKDAYTHCLLTGKVHTQKDFAELLGISRTTLSSAMNGNEQYLTDKFVARVIDAVSSPNENAAETILVLPAEARGGTIADFVETVHEYECERMVSPVRGAQYAMQVVGDSMEPDFPSGAKVIIKQVNEEMFIEWGKIYVLDTDNGALIKQVRKTDRPDVIECVSLNPKYDSFTINTRYIHGWYRVLMVLALK